MAGAAELHRRRREAGIWGEVARWRRGILLGAGALAAASVLTLLLTRPSSESQAESTTVLGIPSQWSEWVASGEQPGPGDLLTIERSES
ncbi:MAG: hypothetical protein GF330_05840 [Candidatus Eisenbacteria bacterium]|nr:hypothetical protein [Candidatus Eisenbacteria bacterium]